MGRLLVFFIMCSSCYFYNSIRIAPSSSVQLPTERMDFFATTTVGLEKVLAQEIKSLPQASRIVINKGSVSFKGTVATGLQALLWLRTPLKLMENIGECDDVSSKDILYNWISSIDWNNIIEPSSTLKCDATLGQYNTEELNHSHFTSLLIKNAIIDQFRRRSSDKIRPSVDLDNPDLSLLLYLHRGKGTLYRMWSGETSMHKRGYRADMTIHKAALRETTAAALLLTACSPLLTRSTVGSDRIEPVPGVLLCDPMCGSGTFVIEAALMVANTAPGLLRYAGYHPFVDRARTANSKVTPVIEEFMVTSQSSLSGREVELEDLMLDSIDPHVDVDRQAVESILEQNDIKILPCPLRWLDTRDTCANCWNQAWLKAVQADKRKVLNRVDSIPVIVANDIHPGSIQLAIQSAGNAGVHRMIRFTCEDVSDLEFESHLQPAVIVTNPPWDKRISDAEEAWRKLGIFAGRLQNNRGIERIPPLRQDPIQDTDADTCIDETEHQMPLQLADRRRKGVNSSIVLWTLSGSPQLGSILSPLKPKTNLPLRGASVDMTFSKYIL